MVRKLGIGSLLLAVVALVGKFGLEYHYGRQLDRLVQLSSPVMLLSYGGVSVGLDGSISVNDISMEPREYPSRFTLEKLRLFSSDRSFLFKGAKVFGWGRLPAQFSIEFLGAEYDPNFGQDVNKSTECRLIDAPMEYSNMGFYNFRSDARLDINSADASNSRLTVASTIFDKSQETIVVDFDATKLTEDTLRSGALPIKTVSYSSTLDSEFAKNLLEYCADKLQMTVEQYLALQVGSIQHVKTLGIALEEPMRDALRKYMQGGAELTLVSTPSSQARNIRQIQFYKPKDLVNILNLTAKLDGETIGRVRHIESLAQTEDAEPQEDEAVKTVEQVEKPAVVDQRPVNLAQVRAPAPETPQKRVERSYQTVRLANASRYVGQRVRVQRKGKADIEGYLVAHKPRLKIERASFGGKMVLPVELEDVRRLQVLR